MSAVSTPDPPVAGPTDRDELSSEVSAEDVSCVKSGWSEVDARAEDALVVAARSDRAAFGMLYDRYFDIIYHYIARRVGDQSVAEDLACEVWERALNAIDRYEIRGLPFAAWLYRIAGNLVANHYRKQRLLRFVPFARDHDISPHGQIDERASVRQALASLSAADQEVLGLCYFAGLPPPEIADVLGCSPAAVHKRLHRARERLRRQIEGEQGDSPTTD